MPNISEMGSVWTPAGNMLFEAASGAKRLKLLQQTLKAIADEIAQKHSN